MRLSFQPDYFAKEFDEANYTSQLKCVSDALAEGRTLYINSEGELATAGWIRRMLLWVFTSRSRTERVQVAIGQLICYGHEKQWLAHGDIHHLVAQIKSSCPSLKSIFDVAVRSDGAPSCMALHQFSKDHRSKLTPSFFEKLAFRGPLFPPPEHFGETYLRLIKEAIRRQDAQSAKSYFEKYLRFGREPEGKMRSITQHSLPLFVQCPDLKSVFVAAITESNARSVMEGLNCYYASLGQKADHAQVLPGVIIEDGSVRKVLYAAVMQEPYLMRSLEVLAFQSNDLMQRLEMAHVLLEKGNEKIKKKTNNDLLTWLRTHLKQEDKANAFTFVQDKPHLCKVFGYLVREKGEHVDALICFSLAQDNKEMRVSALECAKSWGALNEDQVKFVVKRLLEVGEPVVALEAPNYNDEDLLNQVREACGYYYLRMARNEETKDRGLALADARKFHDRIGEDEFQLAEAMLKGTGWDTIDPQNLCLESKRVYWRLTALREEDLGRRLSSWRRLVECYGDEEKIQWPKELEADFKRIEATTERALDHLWFGFTTLQFSFCAKTAACLLSGGKPEIGNFSNWRDHFYKKETCHWEAAYGAWSTTPFGDDRDAHLLQEVAKERYRKKNYAGVIECTEQMGEVPLDLMEMQIEAYRQQKEYDKAIAACQRWQAEAKDSTLYHLYVEYGDHFLSQQKSMEAVQQYERVAAQYILSKEKKQFRIHYAAALQNLLRRGEAIVLLREALKDPTFTTQEKGALRDALEEHEEIYRSNYTNISAEADPYLAKAIAAESALNQMLLAPTASPKPSSPARRSTPGSPTKTQKRVDQMRSHYVEFPADYPDYGSVRRRLAGQFTACVNLLVEPFDKTICYLLAAMTHPDYKLPEIKNKEQAGKWLKEKYPHSPQAKRVLESLGFSCGDDRQALDAQT